MSVKVSLMINNEDRKKIGKSPGYIVGAKEISCELKEGTSLFNPTILVSTSRLTGQWAQANYAHIPDFGGRYYFIDDISAQPGNMLAFHMTVDPLKTYAAQILNNKFEIARAEDLGNGYFIDTEKALQNCRTAYYRILGHIPQSSTGKKYTITVAGG